jgi:hypothetical protein
VIAGKGFEEFKGFKEFKEFERLGAVQSNIFSHVAK